jgi:hypothetical protein
VNRVGPGVAFVACFVVAAILYGGGAGSGAREHGYHPARRSHLLVSGVALAIPFVIAVSHASPKRWFRAGTVIAPSASSSRGSWPPI